MVTTRRVSEPQPAGRAPRIVLRDIETVKEMRLVGELQQRVSRWDEHSAPLVQLIASREVGGILIGAFDGNALVGFVFGFPGYISGRRVLHSHMLAVDPAHRDKDLGFRLKLAQRERALEQGVDQMTWTFDPLRSVNAHLNISKLGVVVESYRVDFYGPEASSAPHRHIGTDRFWVRWHLTSEAVLQKLRGGSDDTLALARRDARPLLSLGDEGRPVRGEAPARGSDDSLVIEIPSDIGAFQRDAPDLAAVWRQATRGAFLSSFDAGYRIESFFRGSPSALPVGLYRLTRSPVGASDGKRSTNSRASNGL